jgi:hypothetical protein
MSLSMSLDERADDLPKTLRNKSLRTSDEPPVMAPPPPMASDTMTFDPLGAVVTDVRIPFWRLVFILMKVALACVPALIIVAAILWGLAEVVGTLFPQLVKLKVQIYVPPR